MKFTDKQMKSLYTLEGLGLGLAIGARGDLGFLIVGLAMALIAFVGISLGGDFRK